MESLLNGEFMSRDGERGGLCEHQRIGAGLLFEKLQRANAVYEAHALSLGGIEYAAGKKKVGGVCGTNGLYEAKDALMKRVSEAKFCGGDAEIGRFSREAKIARQGDQDAAAEAMPIDHGDDGLGRIGDGLETQ